MRVPARPIPQSGNPAPHLADRHGRQAKLPQRLLGTINDCLAAGHVPHGVILAVAGWMRYVGGTDEAGAGRSRPDCRATQSRALRPASLLAIGSVFDRSLPVMTPLSLRCGPPTPTAGRLSRHRCRLHCEIAFRRQRQLSFQIAVQACQAGRATPMVPTDWWAENGGRNTACHVKRVGNIHPGLIDHHADRPCRDRDGHPPVAPHRRQLRFQAYLLGTDGEGGDVATESRHRVRDQKQAPFHQVMSKTKIAWRYMVTVRDDPGEEPAEKRGADNAGFARRKLRAGLNRCVTPSNLPRPPGEPCRNRHCCGPRTGSGQRPSRFEPGSARSLPAQVSEGSAHDARATGLCPRHQAVDMVCLMNAGFFRRQERLEVNAEYLRTTACRDSRQCVAVPGSRCGDVGRQMWHVPPIRAAAAMRPWSARRACH